MFILLIHNELPYCPDQLRLGHVLCDILSELNLWKFSMSLLPNLHTQFLLPPSLFKSCCN